MIIKYTTLSIIIYGLIVLQGCSSKTPDYIVTIEYDNGISIGVERPKEDPKTIGNTIGAIETLDGIEYHGIIREVEGKVVLKILARKIVEENKYDIIIESIGSVELIGKFDNNGDVISRQLVLDRGKHHVQIAKDQK